MSATVRGQPEPTSKPCPGFLPGWPCTDFAKAIPIGQRRCASCQAGLDRAGPTGIPVQYRSEGGHLYDATLIWRSHHPQLGGAITFRSTDGKLHGRWSCEDPGKGWLHKGRIRERPTP